MIINKFVSYEIKILTKDDLVDLVDLHYSVLPDEFLTSISKPFLLGFYQILFSSPHSHFLGAFYPYRSSPDGEQRGVISPNTPNNPLPLRSSANGGAKGGNLPNSRLIAAIVCLEKNFKPKISSYLLLVLKNLSSFLTSPKSLPRAKSRGLISLFQSFLFKLGQPQETEIFFIGVAKEFQGQGLGKKLVQILEKTLSPKNEAPRPNGRGVFSPLRQERNPSEAASDAAKGDEALSVDCKCKLPSNNFYKSCGFKIKKTFRLYNEDWNRYEKKLK